MNPSYIKCPLCGSPSPFFHRANGKIYFGCPDCFCVFLDPSNYLSKQEEKRRYETHNNDPGDEGYQRFVSPVVNEINNRFNKNHSGLDFGAGTGPVITRLLEKNGYNLKLYDPFFWNNPEILKLKYDYIVCCEVVEHFHSPGKEFKLLRSLLNPGGALFCMTAIYSDETDFGSWYYKNDPTHVFFYSRKTFEWIKLNFNFSKLMIKDRLVCLFT